MAAPVTPAKQLANGKDTWWLVPAGVDKNAPKATEINAAAGMNLTGVLLSDYEGLTPSTDKITLPRVMLETSETEVNGATKYSAADMQMTFQPQAAAGSDGKKAWELVNTTGTFAGWAVRRQNSPAGNADATASEFVDVVPVEVTNPTPGKTSTGPEGIYIFTVSVGITGTPAWNKAVVA